MNNKRVKGTRKKFARLLDRSRSD